MPILSFVLSFVGTLSVEASSSEYVTMNVGERKTLFLPPDITSLTLKDVTFTSGDWSKLNIISSTATSVTVEALHKSSYYIPITCEFYYYTLVNGKWIYAYHAPYYFMVAIIGDDPDSDPDPDPDPNPNLDSWTREGNTSRWVCTTNTIEGVSMKFFRYEAWTNFSSVCETYSSDSNPNATCIDKTTSGRITIPDYVNEKKVDGIGSYSFNACEKLTDVIIPNTVELLGGFKDCTGLKNIYLPKNVSFIRSAAFQNCKNLESINLPRTVTQIKSYAFNGCESLRTIYCLRNTPPQLDGYGFFSSVTYDNAILYVPVGSKKSYQTADYWKIFHHIEEIVIPTSVSLSSSQKIGLGTQVKLSATVLPAEAKDTIIWRTSNPHVAIVSSEGVVNGVGIGEADITAITINGLEKVCSVTVQQNDYIVKTSADGYATFFDSQTTYTLPNGLSAHVVTGISNNKLTYKKISDGSASGVVPKGTAVMLESDNKQAGTFTLEPSMSTTTYSGTNLLQGSDEATTTTGDGYHYKLSYGKSGSSLSNVLGWYWGAVNGGAFQIEGHKAWLVLPKSAGSRSFSIDGEATDIETIDIERLTDDNWFDLQGRRISKPTEKGVYICNGKKVMIK